MYGLNRDQFVEKMFVMKMVTITNIGTYPSYHKFTERINQTITSIIYLGIINKLS